MVLQGPVFLANLEVSFFPDYYNQGNKYWNLGKFDLAIAEYEKALSVRPGDHPGAESLYDFLAKVYLKSGQFSRAEALLEKAAARYPDNGAFREELQMVRLLNLQPKPKAKALTPQDPAQ